MATSTTISVSIPIELSILVDTYLGQKHMIRSELVRTALEHYLNVQKEQEDVVKAMYKDIQEIKEYMKKK